jgi:hypothetical protein
MILKYLALVVKYLNNRDKGYSRKESMERAKNGW